MWQAVQRGPRSDSGARGNEEDASSRSDAASRAVEGRRHRGCVRAFIFGDDDLFLGHAEAGGKVGSVPGSGWSRGDHVDVIEAQRRFAKAFVDCLDRRRREPFVDRVRYGEAKHIVTIDETDCGVEAFALIRSICPTNTFDTAVVVGPVAQQCCPCR